MLIYHTSVNSGTVIIQSHCLSLFLRRYTRSKRFSKLNLVKHMFKWRSINCHPMLSCFITTKKRIFLVPHFAATIHFRFYSIVRSSLFCVLSVSPDNDLQSCSVKSALRFYPLKLDAHEQKLEFEVKAVINQLFLLYASLHGFSAV